MRIIVLGYYYRKNLGDDLLHECLELILKKNNFDYVFINPDDEYEISEDDIIILGGGEILNDYFIDKIFKKLNKLKTKPITVSISTECGGIQMIKSTKLDFIDYFITRNKTEYVELVNRYGSEYVKLLPDLIFAYDIENKNLLSEKTDTEFKIGVCVARSIYKNNAKYDNFISKLRNELNLIKTHSKNTQIYLIPFNTSSNQNESDILLNDDLNSSNDFIIIRENQISVLQQMDILICSRFHANVLAIKFNIPFIPIIHTKKLLNLIKTINYDTQYILQIKLGEHNLPEEIDPLDLIKTYNYILTHYEKIKLNLNNISKSYKLEWENFDINQILKKRNKYPLFEPNILIEEKISNLKQIISNIPDAENKTKAILYNITGDTKPSYFYGLLGKISNPNINLDAELKWLINDFNTNYKLLKEPNIIKPLFNLSYIEQNKLTGYHRSGWSYVVDNLEKYDGGDILLDTYLDKTFGWESEFYKKINIIPYTKSWMGFIHHTPDPDYSDNNPINLIRNEYFVESLKYCKCIFVLSKYMKKWLKEELKKNGYEINVFSLVHPTEIPTPDLMFDYNKFIKQNKIIQIGAWLRNIYGIFAIETNNIKKAVLIGKDMENYYFGLKIEDHFHLICRETNKPSTNKYSYFMTQYIDKKFGNTIYSSNNKIKPEIIQLINQNHDSVEIINNLSNDQYDKLLSENIVFLNLINVSACNTLIECIIRNTPIVVNNLEGVVELLGPNYPLYYNDLDDVINILTYDNIIKAHQYLKKLNKSKLHIDTFINSIIQYHSILEYKEINKIIECPSDVIYPESVRIEVNTKKNMDQLENESKYDKIRNKKCCFCICS
jgi:polysaccharide pyruvyl transferase WcaK-like protein